MEKNHLTREQMEYLRRGELPMERVVSALEHIGSCDICARLWADFYAEKELLRVPPGFVEKVEGKVNALHLSTAPPMESRKKELRRYKVKVAWAVCACLILTMSSSLLGDAKRIPLEKLIYHDFTQINAISEKLDIFSEKMIDWEEKNND